MTRPWTPRGRPRRRALGTRRGIRAPPATSPAPGAVRPRRAQPLRHERAAVADLVAAAGRTARLPRGSRTSGRSARNSAEPSVHPSSRATPPSPAGAAPGSLRSYRCSTTFTARAGPRAFAGSSRLRSATPRPPAARPAQQGVSRRRARSPRRGRRGRLRTSRARARRQASGGQCSKRRTGSTRSSVQTLQIGEVRVPDRRRADGPHPGPSPHSAARRPRDPRAGPCAGGRSPRPRAGSRPRPAPAEAAFIPCRGRSSWRWSSSARNSLATRFLPQMPSTSCRCPRRPRARAAAGRGRSRRAAPRAPAQPWIRNSRAPAARPASRARIQIRPPVHSSAALGRGACGCGPRPRRSGPAARGARSSDTLVRRQQLGGGVRRRRHRARRFRRPAERRCAASPEGTAPRRAPATIATSRSTVRRGTLTPAPA